jgi:hypothetical protein
VRNPFRSFPLFFLMAVGDLLDRVMAAVKEGSNIEPFPVADAHMKLNGVVTAKSDRDAMLILGQTVLSAAEWNSNNIMRLRNRLDRHEFKDKVCSYIYSFLFGVILSSVVWLAKLHWGT